MGSGGGNFRRGLTSEARVGRKGCESCALLMATGIKFCVLVFLSCYQAPSGRDREDPVEWRLVSTQQTAWSKAQWILLS